jgi:hypothetical protein
MQHPVRKANGKNYQQDTDCRAHDANDGTHWSMSQIRKDEIIHKKKVVSYQ